MKYLVLLFLLVITQKIQASENLQLGLGAMVGEPTAVSAQIRGAEKILNANVGTSLHAEPTFLIDAKFLFPKILPKLIRKPNSPIVFYGGIGGFMKFTLSFRGTFSFGVRLYPPWKTLWILF